MSKPLIVEYYEELPPVSPGHRDGKQAAARLQTALSQFRERVAGRYTEGTLQRLLNSSTMEARRAAVLALGMVGGMQSNGIVAALLRDGDRITRRLAADALWSIWFRAEGDEAYHELRRLSRLPDARDAAAGLGGLIQRHPEFAEAFNQRASIYFRLEQYAAAIADCQHVIKLNPHHFGAMAGMGQAYMKLQKPRAALRALKGALKINPGLEGVQETIHFLEDALGGEGKKDDKK